MTDCPISIVSSWLDEARASEPNDPNAMALATVDADGSPSVRMVLLKDHGPDGFVFYTNLQSRKGAALATNPRAALLFHWKSLQRQVQIEGPVSAVSDAEADAYFASRARDSRIGAWASDQSRPLSSRAAFMARIAETTARYAIGAIPRPPHWSGFRVTPERIELWQDKPFRLHERRLFVADTADGPGRWTESLLYP
jgi:pyridoxamine 5'-phosphate oxidase